MKIFLSLFLLYVKKSFLSNPDVKCLFTESAYTLIDMKKVAEAYCSYLIENYEDSKEKVCLKTKMKVKNFDESINKKVFAIDIGGTYLKICIVHFINNESNVLNYEKFEIKKELKTKEVDLFEWVAQMLNEYLSDKGEETTGIKEGAMTFSYPIKQDNCHNGEILSFGKDFPFRPIDLSEPKDPVKLLNNALKCLKIDLEIKIILNDANATFLSGYLTDSSTKMGIVLGTGSNCAFYTGDMVNDQIELINSEWGKFDNVSFKKSKYDDIIKETVLSENAVYQNVDYMIGGVKFIEIINLMYKDFTNTNKTISKEEIAQIRNQSDENNGNIENLELKKKICEYFKSRSISILASLVIGIVEKNNFKGKIGINLNGSAFNGCGEWKKLKEMLDELARSMEITDVEFSMSFNEHASLLGCAYALVCNPKSID
ncbi:hexokinase [Hamiltosporidium magnivora]|uniref:Phosphotransferase n=1 Tax=Hamiltosporidium magnivora TaxID=148818 RepID=A0A4Q9L8N5_9MICR|nr:hexokinase [Hamiltosporidium magnivora]